MANLVIAYPDIDTGDFNWIQEIRKSHDPMYFNVVKPHVTLVFGTEKLDSQQLADFVKTKIQNFHPFSIRFDSTKVVEDDSGNFFHLFLVPSAGYNEIQQLHDILYTDALKGELRLDIPFIPHVGIGTSTSEQEMINLSDSIKGKVIEGRLNKLTVVEYESVSVQDIEAISLTVQ